MKICNKELLDANIYDQIIIKSTNNKQIEVKGNKQAYSTIMVGEPFSEKLNNLDDEKVILGIAKQFLNWTEISELAWVRYLPQYNQYFSTVGNHSKLLAFQDSFRYEELTSLMWNKYDSDRRNFLERQNDVKVYRISDDSYGSFYRRNDYSNIGSNIEINLSRLDFNNIEQCFFNDFISDKIKSSDSEVCINQEEFYRLPEDDFLSYINVIRVDGIVIELSDSVVPKVQSILDEFNNNLQIQKKMQLKLEGF